jgi:hypothetical protein
VVRAGRGGVLHAGLVEGEAVDGLDEQEVSLHGHPRRQPTRPQDREHALGVAQRVGAHRDAADRDADEVGVAQAGGALGPRHVLELLAPAWRVGVRDLLLADHVVEHQVQQAVLAADVPVQRGGPGAQLFGEPAHAERREALAVKEVDRRDHDRLPADRLAPAPGLPVG